MGKINVKVPVVVKLKYLEPEMSYQEIAEVIGVSKQYVREIEASALKKLRKYKRAMLLKDFVEND